MYVSGTAGTGNDVGWRMLAAPCASRNRSHLSFNSSITGDDEVRLFDESAGVEDARWLNVASATTLPQGQGFIAYLYDDSGLTIAPGFGIGFSGCTETTSDFDRTGLDVNEQFFLAGNPYYTSFDLSDGLDLPTAGHQATVQVWDPTAGGGTGSYQLIVRGSANDQIAMGQGFFVQRTTTGAGATTLPFKAAGRTNGASFIGKEEGSTWAQLDLRLEGHSQVGVTIYDEAIAVLFHPDGSYGWDAYETSKFLPISSTYATASLLGERDGTPIARALASYPLALNQPLAIPIQIDGRGYEGVLTFTWPTLDQLPSTWTIELEDVATRTRINLRDVTSYGFRYRAPAGKTEEATTITTAPIAVAAQDGNTPFILHITPDISTSTESTQPLTFALESAYPNPFNPQTTIRYALATPSEVRLVVFDALGREVAVLTEGVQATGRYQVTFDARGLSSGLYLYRIETPEFQATKSILLLK